MKITHGSTKAFFAITALLTAAAVASAAGATSPTGPQGPPVKAVSTDTPNTAALRDGSGNFAMNTLNLDGNLNLPATTSSTGILFVGGVRFLHGFGTDNTFVGSAAGNLTMTGDSNTATGTSALSSNTTGRLNTAVGWGALIDNTTGATNTAVGDEALNSNTAGGANIAIGHDTLLSNTTGGGNVAVGAFALERNLFGFGNIAVGDQAGSNLTTGSANIDIGNPGVAAEADTIRIGENQAAAFIAGIRGKTTGNNDAVAVVIDSNGQLGTVSSSRRYKEDIRDMASASDRLLRLRPVTFRYKKPFADGEKPIQYGLIAEEVAEIFPDLVAYGRDKKPETVKYQMLSSLLLNELEKQQAKMQDQAAEMTSLKQELTEQRAAFAALASRVSSMERKSVSTELARTEVPAN